MAKKATTKTSAPKAPSPETIKSVAEKHADVKPTVLIASVATLLALSVDDLAGRMKEQAAQAASQHIGMGKMLYALDAKREGKGTLSGFVKQHGIPEIDSSAYKAQNAFRMVGEGHGTIAEGDYDECKLRWLIVTSQILNVLDKHTDDTFKATVREEVAKALRARTDKTPDILAGIYDQLKPEKKDKGGDGDGANGEGEDAEEKEHGPRLRKASVMEIASALFAALLTTGEQALASTDLPALQATAERLPVLAAEIEKSVSGCSKLGELLAARIAELSATSTEAAPAAPVEIAA